MLLQLNVRPEDCGRLPNCRQSSSKRYPGRKHCCDLEISGIFGKMKFREVLCNSSEITCVVD